jgi:hypothetical protein
MKLTRQLTITALAFGSIAIPAGFAVAGSLDSEKTAAVPTCGTELFGDQFVRTELFFGLSRPGGRITEHQFDRFVDEEITPRFPDGLTVVSGLGQFRLDSGDIIEERSKVLVLLHGGEDVDSKEIEEIRAAYISRFDQQSVLRTDEPSCVSF